MKVKIKQFSVDMEVKTNGIEFEVREPDDSAQVGDCYLTKTGLTWCKGKTTKQKGLKLKWDDLAAILSSPAAKKAAIAAAKGV